MPVTKQNQVTGYSPVKPEEQETAAKTGHGDRDDSAYGDGSTYLTADQIVITDAIAAVIEKHRAEIASAPVSPKARRYASDLLDSVHLDLLQTVLDEASALRLLSDRRGAGA